MNLALHIINQILDENGGVMDAQLLLNELELRYPKESKKYQAKRS